MWTPKTLTSVQRAADAVTRTAEQLDNLRPEQDLSAMLAEAEDVIFDVKTAAQAATFAFAAVAIVAVAALVLATVALRKGSA